MITRDGADKDLINDEQQRREEVITACRHLSAMGLSPGSSGNISVRWGAGLLVTPTGSSLHRVLPEELVLVSLDADGPRPGTASPSKEVPLHRAVYARRPDTQAVVHLHSPHAVAASCLPRSPNEPTLPALTPYQVMRTWPLPTAAYARPGSTALADGVANLAAEHQAILMANHGSVAAGGSLWSAVALAEEIEAAAQVSLLTRGLDPRPLTVAQVDELSD